MVLTNSTTISMTNKSVMTFFLSIKYLSVTSEIHNVSDDYQKCIMYTIMHFWLHEHLCTFCTSFHYLYFVDIMPFKTDPSNAR